MFHKELALSKQSAAGPSHFLQPVCLCKSNQEHERQWVSQNEMKLLKGSFFLPYIYISSLSLSPPLSIYLYLSLAHALSTVDEKVESANTADVCSCVDNFKPTW